MSKLILFNFKLFVVFGMYYLLTQFIIKFLLKKTSFSIKYAAIKLMPLLCFATLGVNFIVKSTTSPFNSIFLNYLGNISSKIEITTDDSANFLMPLFIKKCFIFIWIIGIIILLLKYCMEYFCFRRVYRKSNLISSTFLTQELTKCKKKLGIKRHIDIFYGMNTDTPFTFGIIKPGIIIPLKKSENLSPIILHELVHCSHNDMFVKTVYELLKLFHWFNPFIYFYIHDLEYFCELACDECVSKLLTFGERKNYAYEIIKNARKHKYPIFLATFSSAQNYKKRLYNLLYPTYCNTKKGKILLPLCAIMVVGCGIFMLQNFDNSSFSELFINTFSIEESQVKTIRVNYLPGQEQEDYYYEEYIDAFWWRGTLLAESSRKVSDNLTEITFSGEIYKCND